jgi:hypothetical protein
MTYSARRCDFGAGNSPVRLCDRPSHLLRHQQMHPLARLYVVPPTARPPEFGRNATSSPSSLKHAATGLRCTCWSQRSITESIRLAIETDLFLRSTIRTGLLISSLLRYGH